MASVCAIATLSVSRASSVAAGHRLARLDQQRLAGGERLVVGSGRRVAERVEIPSVRQRALDRAGVERARDVVEVVGVAGVRLGVAQRDHRAAPEVEQRLAVRVRRPDPQRDQAGGLPPASGSA